MGPGSNAQNNYDGIASGIVAGWGNGGWWLGCSADGLGMSSSSEEHLLINTHSCAADCSKCQVLLIIVKQALIQQL